MARFTKQEMLNELRELVIQYARAASFVIDPGAGLRLLKRDPPSSPVLDGIMDPELTADSLVPALSIGGLAITGTVEQFYDYGLMGNRDFEIRSVIGATEWTFAFGFIRDMANSLLVSESLNGEAVDAPKCMQAARMFFARLVLDGGERFDLDRSRDSISIPEDLLTLGEVALLADLDERTIRNATSKNAPNRLGTTTVGSSIYIPREAAIAWLTTKRGFAPTRVGTQLPAATLASDFVSTTEAGDFVRKNRERQKLSPSDVASSAGSAVASEDITSLEEGHINLDEHVLAAIGDALGLNGPLFALRLLQAQKKTELQALQARINATEQ